MNRLEIDNAVSRHWDLTRTESQNIARVRDVLAQFSGPLDRYSMLHDDDIRDAARRLKGHSYLTRVGDAPGEPTRSPTSKSNRPGPKRGWAGVKEGMDRYYNR